MILETAYDAPDERLELVWSALSNGPFLGCLKTLRTGPERAIVFFEAWRETRDPANRKVSTFASRDDALDFLSGAP